MFKLTAKTMPRILHPCVAVLAACASSPQEAAVRRPDPGSATTVPGAPTPARTAGRRADSPAEARGRRTLSTAFVGVGPDGHLTVELRDGQALVLRDVVMRARDYCGARVSGGKAGARTCGGYADIVAARPGGAPVAPGPALPDPSPRGSPAKRR